MRPLALIIVADDSSTVRAVVCAMLGKLGHTVVEACDGNECIAKLSTGNPALVITDIFMPQKDGIETILEIRRDWPGVKILAISGGRSIRDLRQLSQAKDLGADQILSKPFAAHHLIDAVNSLLPG